MKTRTRVLTKKDYHKKENHNIFLRSAVYRSKMQRFLGFITKNYSIPLYFSKPGEGSYTDGKRVFLGSTRDELDKIRELSLEEKMCLNDETTAHEGFHILYTDFAVLKMMNKTYETDPLRLKIAHAYNNIVEDGAINIIGTFVYKGLKKHFLLGYDLYSQLIKAEEVEKKCLISAHQRACLYYALYEGDYDCEFENPELARIFELSKPIVIEGLMGRTSYDRYDASKKLMDLIEPFIKKVESGEMEFGGGISLDTKFVPGEAPPGAKPMPMPKELEDELRKKFGKGKPSDEEGEGSEGEKPEDGERPEGSDEKEDDKDGEGTGEPKDESLEPSSRPAEEKDELSERDFEAEMDKYKKGMEKEIDSLSRSVEREEENERLMREREERMHKHLGDLSYKTIHRGFKNVEIDMRKDDYSLLDRYMKLYQEVAIPARLMANNLENIIRYNHDMKLTSLSSGLLNQSHLYKAGFDANIFYQRKDKSIESDLCFLLLIDQSGSMGWGSRMTYARLASVLFAEVCQQLGIPIAIVGHSAPFGTHKNEMRKFIGFERDVESQKHSLTLMTHHQDNRDGFALQYALEYLDRQPQTDKILISICDGEPLHGVDGYSGKKTIIDCGNTIKEYADRIMTIGLAIGDGKEGIAKIYENFVSVDRLDELPKQMVSIIEKNLLK